MYEPLSREFLLAKGTCCFKPRGEQSRCVFCPWYVPRQHKDISVDPRISLALKSGETVTLYSDRMSLVPSVTLQGRVTIVYKGYVG